MKAAGKRGLIPALVLAAAAAAIAVAAGAASAHPSTATHHALADNGVINSN